MRYRHMTTRTALSAVAALAASGAVAAGAAAAGGSSGSATGDSHGAKYSAWDEQWLQTSIAGDRFEIAGGKIAEAKGSPIVQALGARLIKDHTQSLEESVALAKRLGIEVPTEPEPSMQWELSIVRSLSNAQFNYWYSSLEVKDHQQDIQETTDEVNDGTNQDVRKLASTDLPMLQTHLELSEQALKASPNTSATTTTGTSGSIKKG